MKINKTLYILEKIWHFEPGIKLSSNNIYEYLVRPCNVSYSTYRRFMLGLPTKTKTITHEGCIAHWWPKTYRSHGEFETFEEFMIYVDVNKNATPLIENWCVEFKWKTYYAKTIDLKKNEIIYDKEKELLEKLNEQCCFCINQEENNDST